MEIYTEEEQVKLNNKTAIPSTALNYGKIFLWFGIGILITGVVGFTLPYLLGAIFNGNGTKINTAYSIMVIISAIATLVLMILIHFNAFRQRSALVVTCYSLYSIAFGILMSSALSFAGAELSAYAFLITGGIMLVVGILGSLLGNRVKSVYMLIGALVFGSLIISLVNVFLFNETIYWIASFAIFAAVLLITAVDFANIKRIAQSYPNFDTGTAIICAYTLYTDFIYIFLRVLMILAASKKD
ncbi:MAG TPA: hypothetical protein DCY93_00195 [Firmicutes bacterium]|nr:hypothetical protein [Bacillota bacterium]